MSSRKIRFARWEDLDAITMILKREFGDRPSEVRTWQRGIEENLGLMIVFIEDAILRGFAGVQFATESTVIFHSDGVDPDHRRQGIGTALTLARIAMLDEVVAPYDIGVLALERHIAFYQRFGFCQTSEVEYDPALGWSLAQMERIIEAVDIESASSQLAALGIALALDELPENA
jgi:N-acetylglutamate synthase-like GNAT family acetyltransferase